MKAILITCVLSAILCLPTPTFAAESYKIVATIKPLHSLLASVMGDTGTPILLLNTNSTPHDFNLKPSQMRAIHRANMIFYIDEEFETFLQDVFESLSASTQKAGIIENANVTVFTSRQGGEWENHKHSPHHHSTNNLRKHNDYDDDHEKNEDDFHVWLSPENAKEIVKYITKKLSMRFPHHRKTYKQNSVRVLAQIDALKIGISNNLAPVLKQPFLVFHDAYQYFEHAFGLNAVGSIIYEPGHRVSPKRIRAIRKKLKETNAKCVFSEPASSARILNVIIEDTRANYSTLDPLGTTLKAGKSHYLELMHELAKKMRLCLTN